MSDTLRCVAALVVACAGSACVSTTLPAVQPLPASRGEPQNSEGGYVQAHATGSIAAVRAAWRTQVRQRCGAGDHEEEMVYEYTYEVLASEPRERVIVVREGYVRCKPVK